MKLECDLMNLEHDRRVNKDNFETQVSIQYMDLMDGFCELVWLHFASFHMGHPWGHWAKISRMNPMFFMVWTELGIVLGIMNLQIQFP